MDSQQVHSTQHLLTHSMLPMQRQELLYGVQLESGNVITIGWKANPNYDYPTGYQVQIYSLNGKTRLYTTKATTKTRVKINNAKVRKAINNKGFKVRIRAYQRGKWWC